MNANPKRTPEMKEDEIIYANFEPSDSKLLRIQSNGTLLMDNPILSSVLSKIFPYLLIFDNVLEIITWTNADIYLNIVLMVVYSVIVVYWHYLNLVILPFTIVFIFLYVIWLVNSIIFDIKHNEKPTIDEILYTLHNINVRFEMLINPIKRSKLQKKNLIRILVITSLMTPFQFLLITHIISPNKFCWLLGLFVLSYHSPWSYSIRMLLWRSVYIRLIVFYLTGLDIKLHVGENKPHVTSDSLDILSGFKIVNKAIESPTRLSQTIMFEVLENERRWLGLGWSKFLFPNERSNYCFEDSLIEAAELSQFQFPAFNNDLYSYKWEWTDPLWSIDKEYSKNKNNGWQFFDNNWENGDYSDGFLKFTRSRKWTRRAKLVIDKQQNVYDE